LWSASCLLQARLHDAEFRQRPPRYQRNPLTELYRCRDDRWFILAAVNQQREWPLLAECLEHSEWLSDPRYATIEKRLENSGDLTRAIEAAVLTRDWPDWHARFIKHGLTVGVVGSPDDHLEDAQIAANGMFPEYANGGGLRTIDNPVRVADAERKAPRMAPAIGADTRTILKELGLSAGEIATMIEAGAAGTA
jgi:crotonobetainyl-CoA:carnitine CoA-transferase CaiB-like acyl-CoA transferase